MLCAEGEAWAWALVLAWAPASAQVCCLSAEVLLLLVHPAESQTLLERLHSRQPFVVVCLPPIQASSWALGLPC